MLTVDGFLLANALRTGKIADFLLERPKDVMRTVRGVNRMGAVLARATPRLLNPEWAIRAEKVLVK